MMFEKSIEEQNWEEEQWNCKVEMKNTIVLLIVYQNAWTQS